MKGKKSRMPGKTTPPDTAEATKETTTANNASATNRHQVQKRGNINRNNNRTLVDIEEMNYEGDTPEVGGILALCTENLTNKLTFDTFQEKLATYINKELTHATDVVCVVKHMKYPKINFDIKNKPKELAEEEAKSSVNKMIQYQEVNQYVYKKQALNKNLNKIFAIIWGQYTSGVQSI